MKALNLLLFAAISLGGFGEAAPYAANLEETLPSLEPVTGETLPVLLPRDDKIPAFKTVSLAPQATSYHFYKSSDSQTDKDPAVAAVLSKMKQDGLFTAVVMRGAKTSIVGPPEGKVRPDKFVMSQQKKGENALVTNGGFFIVSDPLLKADLNGPPLDPKKYRAFAVGPTSVSKNSVAVPGVYADLYEKISGDDGSFLTSGPDLKKPVDTKIPDPKLANTKAGRLQYWVKTPDGKMVPNPAKDRNNPYLQTVFTHLPGGLCTVNEPNERNVLVYVGGGIKIAVTYNSQRSKGMRINELRTLIDQFLKSYLKKSIDDTQIALNLDGGGSIFMGWLKDGKLSILAAGSVSGGPKLYPQNPKGLASGFREVPNMVKHDLV